MAVRGRYRTYTYDFIEHAYDPRSRKGDGPPKRTALVVLVSDPLCFSVVMTAP
jgi:hypothetical protein